MATRAQRLRASSSPIWIGEGCDSATGLEAALVMLWGEDLPIHRCTVHKHRNLLAHTPKRLHDELGGTTTT